MSGTQRLIAVLSDTNGWKRSLPLTTEAPFEGGEFTVRGALNLDEVQRLMDSLETETGIKKDHYEIAVIPDVSAMGLISGQPFSEVFAPRLGFRIDPLQLQLLPPGLRESDPRMPSQSGVVRIMQVEPNTLPILGSKLAVGDARRLALLGLTLCVAVGLAVGFYLLRGVGEDEPSRIAARLGSMLVSIRSEGPRGGRIVDVESIDDLARLAERAGGVVLHEVKGTTHHYLVQDGQTIYRYQAFGRRVEAVAAAAEPVGQ